MARIFFQPGIRGVSGKMGDWVYKIKKGENGKTTISAAPPSRDGELSAAQVDHQKNFEKARNYANKAMADETSHAFYATRSKETGTPVFALAIGDYFNAPTMDDLDLSGYHGQLGDRILITTHDDVGVVNVNLEITKADGTLIEKGNAVQASAGKGIWFYTATVPVPVGTDIFIEAEGFDRPGSRAVASANPIVG